MFTLSLYASTVSRRKGWPLAKAETLAAVTRAISREGFLGQERQMAGDEGIGKSEQPAERPDVVLLSLLMPKMDVPTWLGQDIDSCVSITITVTCSRYIVVLDWHPPNALPTYLTILIVRFTL